MVLGAARRRQRLLLDEVVRIAAVVQAVGATPTVAVLIEAARRKREKVFFQPSEAKTHGSDSLLAGVVNGMLVCHQTFVQLQSRWLVSVVVERMEVRCVRRHGRCRWMITVLADGRACEARGTV